MSFVSEPAGRLEGVRGLTHLGDGPCAADDEADEAERGAAVTGDPASV